MKSNPTQPLGIIPTPELKKARMHIHNILDPLWKSGRVSRGVIYAKLTESLGWKYHTANIRDITEARKVYKLLQQMQNSSRT